MYAVSTHWTLWRSAPKTDCRRGMAILTIVESRMAMNTPMMTTIATIHLYCRPEPCRAPCPPASISALLLQHSYEWQDKFLHNNASQSPLQIAMNFHRSRSHMEKEESVS